MRLSSILLVFLVFLTKNAAATGPIVGVVPQTCACTSQIQQLKDDLEKQNVAMAQALKQSALSTQANTVNMLQKLVEKQAADTQRLMETMQQQQQVTLTLLHNMDDDMKSLKNNITGIHGKLACPNGYKMYGKKCYKINHTPTKWKAARDICHLDGGHLPTITSKDINDWIAQAIDDDKLSKNQNFYIGGNDMNKERKWIWESTGDKITGFQNWNPGEPNNRGDQDCMQIYGRNKKWNDRDCNVKLAFICEI